MAQHDSTNNDPSPRSGPSQPKGEPLSLRKLLGMDSAHKRAAKQKKLEATLEKMGIGHDRIVAMEDVQVLEKLGQGGFGSVHRVLVRGQPAAAKYVTLDLSKSSKRLLENEVKIWSSVQHPNCVSLIGASIDGNKLVLFCELMSGGSLFSQHTQRLKNKAALLTTAECALRMLQVSSGMAYMHAMTPPLIHRDLKSHNILIRSDGERLKISDFGLARLSTASVGNMTAETGSYRWMAPEVMRHEPYGPKCDVYSFAILSWEMCTYRVPFPSQTPVQVAMGVATGTLRPEIPEHISGHLAALIRRCWSYNPEERPTFTELKEEIIAILEKELPRSRRTSIRGNLPVHGGNVFGEMLPSSFRVASPSPAISSDEDRG